MTPAHAADTPRPARLTGDWSGPQAHLSLTDEGGRLELGCATVGIEAPIRPDSAGRFAANGRLEAFDGGPTRAEVPPKRDSVRLDGRVDGDSLEISIDRGGTVANEIYTLHRGRRGKIIRCN